MALYKFVYFCQDYILEFDLTRVAIEKRRYTRPGSRLSYYGSARKLCGSLAGLSRIIRLTLQNEWSFCACSCLFFYHCRPLGSTVEGIWIINQLYRNDDKEITEVLVCTKKQHYNNNNNTISIGS